MLAWRSVVELGARRRRRMRAVAEPALELARRSGDDGALAAAFTAQAMLAALRGDLPANARFYEIALDHATRAGDVAKSCASAPTGAAGSPSRASTPRRSPSSTRRSRPPSLPAPTRSRRSPTTTAARPTSPSACSIWRSPTCAERPRHLRPSGVEPHPLPTQQHRLRAILRGQHSEAIALFDEASESTAAERDPRAW